MIAVTTAIVIASEIYIYKLHRCGSSLHAAFLTIYYNSYSHVYFQSSVTISLHDFSSLTSPSPQFSSSSHQTEKGTHKFFPVHFPNRRGQESSLLTSVNGNNTRWRNSRIFPVHASKDKDSYEYKISEEALFDKTVLFITVICKHNTAFIRNTGVKPVWIRNTSYIYGI
jgi:hypothetical protein